MGHYKNLYDILGIDPHADMVTIWVAYERLAKEYNPLAAENAGHPGVAAHYQQVRTAYLTLSNPAARALYNRSLEEPEISSRPAVAATAPPNSPWRAVSLLAMAVALLLAAVLYLALR